MPSQKTAASTGVILLILLGIFLVTHLNLRDKHTFYQYAHPGQWLGVIDMDSDMGIHMDKILRGEDALLLLDSSNPLFQQLLQRFLAGKTTKALYQFEIGDFDFNGDGLLTGADPIYPLLKIVYFLPNGKYQTRKLTEAGIRAIKVKHIHPFGDHSTIMSDGTRRTLYEINKVGATSIYISRAQKIVTHLPEPPNRRKQF